MLALSNQVSFLCYRTKEYKLHYYETLSRMKFVMLTGTNTNNLQLVLHQIWATLYLEYVAKNPLSPVEHSRGVGVFNELFDQGLERFIVSSSIESLLLDWRLTCFRLLRLHDFTQGIG
jgi:hypothetical protein